MQFGPRLHQTPLFLGKLTSENIHRLNADNRHSVLIIGMEVWHVVRRASSENIRITIPKNRLSSGTTAILRRSSTRNPRQRMCCSVWGSNQSNQQPGIDEDRQLAVGAAVSPAETAESVA